MGNKYRPWMKKRFGGKKGKFVGQPSECTKVLGSDECLEQFKRRKSKICKRCRV
ncbi:MAG: hypothetical protein WC349_04045 [Patescibacteria group bacterium]|jgi:hypothetical protein